MKYPQKSKVKVVAGFIRVTEIRLWLCKVLQNLPAGASVLRGLGEQSPTFLKVGVDGLVIWLHIFV